MRQDLRLTATNIEWGNLGSGQKNTPLPDTSYDRTLDQNSTNPGEQRFEKLISGRYLGETSRLILLDILPLHSHSRKLLSKVNAITSSTMSRFMNNSIKINGTSGFDMTDSSETTNF